MTVNQAVVIPVPSDSGVGTTSIPQRKRRSRRVQRREKEKQAPEEVNRAKSTERILSFVLISAREVQGLQHV